MCVTVRVADAKHSASEMALNIDGHLIKIGRSDNVHFNFNPSDDTADNNETDHNNTVDAGMLHTPHAQKPRNLVHVLLLMIQLFSVTHYPCSGTLRPPPPLLGTRDIGFSL